MKTEKVSCARIYTKTAFKCGKRVLKFGGFCRFYGLELFPGPPPMVTKLMTLVELDLTKKATVCSLYTK